MISVVIPTYNSEKYITETLESVFLQTHSDYEVVVSDDGSTDNTVSVVKALFDRFSDKTTRLLVNDHEGPGAARNKGIEAAKGKWIAFLDSDDKWYPEKLQKVADYILNNKEIALVCHSEIWEDSPGEKLLNYSKGFNIKISPFLSLYRGNSLSTSAVTVKKDLLTRAGLFDTTFPSAQDYDLWLRLALIPGIRIGYIEEPLGEYITRQGNISSNIEQRHDCLMRIGRKYLQDLKKCSKYPFIERMRFDGKVYAGTGLNLIRKKSYKKGVLYFAAGMLKWPRVDWVYKFIFKKSSN